VAPRAILFYPKITDEEVERVMSEIRAEPGAIEVRPLHLRKEELGLFEGWQVEEEDIARMAAKVGAKLDEFFA
jgi:DNA repair photolyase